MTGFGVSTFEVAGRRFVLETRSLNHRYLDLKVSLPRPLNVHEPDVVAAIRARVNRGRVEISARPSGIVPGVRPRVEADIELARAVRDALEEVRSALGIDAPVSLELLTSVRDVVRLVDEPEEPCEEVSKVLCAALDDALDHLVAMREREGAAMAADIRTALAEARGIVDIVAAGAGERSEQHVSTLRERLDRVAARLGSPPVDEARVAQEVVVLADRLDVSEELARLGSHFEQLEEVLAAGGSVGRRVDFLLQEMGREANTLGAKSYDAEVTEQVIVLKAAVERMREQVQNLE